MFYLTDCFLVPNFSLIIHLFSLIINSLNKLNEDLTKIYQKAYQWKMLLNPEVSKQAKEACYSRMKNINYHSVVFFDNFPK